MKKILLFLFLLSPLWGKTNQQQGATPNTAGLWHFNDESITAYDNSGNGNNGTYNGTSTTDGIFDKARDFNGTSDYVNCGNDSSLNPTNKMTVCVWIKRKTLSNNIAGFILARDDDASGRSYGFGIRNSEGYYCAYFEKAGAPQLALKNGNEIPTSTTFLAFVFDSSKNEISTYFNGVFNSSATTTGTLNSTTGDTTIAERTYSGYENRYNGIIDELAVYNRALSAAEIKDKYEAQSEAHQ